MSQSTPATKPTAREALSRLNKINFLPPNIVFGWKVNAVSYTHLDVYKRQPHSRFISAVCNYIPATTFHKMDRRLGENLIWLPLVRWAGASGFHPTYAVIYAVKEGCPCLNLPPLFRWLRMLS